jgi:phosphoribosyl 1,2-cyclic phosphodiesterase
MKFCALGSGSKGNCIYVSDGETSILVDAGLPFSILKERLLMAGIALDSITAILFTHDHSDHYQVARGLARSCPAASLYANEDTAEAIDRALSRASFQWRIFESTTPFEVGSMTITPFPVPHNAADPVGFTIECMGRKLGLATDLGCAVPAMRRRLADCHALILESNYDYGMLMASKRPWSVRCRIDGIRGHLSNDAAAEFIQSMHPSNLKSLHLAHISDQCNTVYYAHHRMSLALAECGLEDIKLTCFFQNEPSCMYEV